MCENESVKVWKWMYESESVKVILQLKNCLEDICNNQDSNMNL